jgi:hypothetical protein
MRIAGGLRFVAMSALSAGVPLTVVADFAGDTPATILRYYAHAMPHDQERMSAALDAEMRRISSEKSSGRGARITASLSAVRR